MSLGYQEALDFLFPRVTTIKFGLDTTRALLASVGDPHRLCPIVHVAGTNGKGSVSTLVARALSAAGWKVGLYTSPHLVSFRERIVVDEVQISESAVAMWTERGPIVRAGERGIRAREGEPGLVVAPDDRQADGVLTQPCLRYPKRATDRENS